MAEAKQFGGWYDNPATGKNQRWWGEGIWTSGEDPTGGQGQNWMQNVSQGLGSLSGMGSNLFGYDLPTLQTNFQNTYSQLQSAQKDLEGYQTRRYEEEYEKAGLTKLKDEIGSLDTNIASEKQTRDESISKVRKNPGYSAATITGETAEIQRLANATINNLIEQRNSKAEEYNASLGEVTRRVATETSDKQNQVASMQYNLQFLGGLLNTYQQVRSQELAAKTESERWEKEFELQLYNAQTSRISATKSSGGGSSSMQQVKDAWGNVIGYFNPATGETQYYQSQSDQSQQTTIPSSGLRSKIREAWKQGYTADTLKSAYGGAVTDTGESVSSIIDDEWKIKTAPGIGGFLGRLFRLGV